MTNRQIPDVIPSARLAGATPGEDRAKAHLQLHQKAAALSKIPRAARGGAQSSCSAFVPARESDSRRVFLEPWPSARSSEVGFRGDLVIGISVVFGVLCLVFLSPATRDKSTKTSLF